MKDFAKSIKVENAKDKNEKDIKIGDVVEVFFDKKGTYEPDRSDRFYSDEVVKIGNKKVGNDQDLFNNYKDWTIHSYKDKKGGFSAEIIKKGSGRGFDETSSYSSESGAIDAAKKLIDMYVKEVGNKKVGNADIFRGNYIDMSDDGDIWFQEQSEEIPYRNLDSWSREKIRVLQAEIKSIENGVKEAKQAIQKLGLK